MCLRACCSQLTRCATQIETLRATADPSSPYRTGPQPTATKKPPHLLPPRNPFELSELDSEWFALFSKYDLHGDDRLDVHEVSLRELPGGGVLMPLCRCAC